MSLKKHFTLWKPPSSKAMKLTEQDTLFTEGIIEFVEKYYYDNVRYTKRRQGLSVTNIETPMQFYEKGSRINDDMKYIILVIVGLMVGVLKTKKHIHIY